MHQVEIKVRFRSGHRLMEPYEGKCNNPHGEGYTAILIFESNKLDKNGMVLDFGKVRKEIYNIVNDYYDHAFFFNKNDKVGGLKDKFYSLGFKIYLFDDNPTAEVIAKDLYDKVKGKYPQLKRVGIVESFDDSIAWYEETKNITPTKIFDKEVDLKKFGDKFFEEAKKMFQGIKLDAEAPDFDWEKKKCAKCQKPIPGFSEWCTYHFKKRRDFCSQKCFDNFTDEYRNKKEEGKLY